MQELTASLEKLQVATDERSAARERARRTLVVQGSFSTEAQKSAFESGCKKALPSSERIEFKEGKVEILMPNEQETQRVWSILNSANRLCGLNSLRQGFFPDCSVDFDGNREQLSQVLRVSVLDINRNDQLIRDVNPTRFRSLDSLQEHWCILELFKECGVSLNKPYTELLPVHYSFDDAKYYTEAWKSLLLEECRTQLAQAWHRFLEAGKAVSEGALWYRVKTDGRDAPYIEDDQGDDLLCVSLLYKREQDELNAHDAVIVSVDGGRFREFGIVTKLSGFRVSIALCGAADGEQRIPRNGLEKMDIGLFYATTLVTAGRAWQSLSRYPDEERVHDSLLHSFCLRSNDFDTQPVQQDSLKMPATLNDGQKKALSMIAAIKKGIIMCQGPPGTGKTTLTVEAINHYLSRGAKRILVCAPSNKAVFELLERFRLQYPKTLVLFTGSKRRQPPPLVQEVYWDECFRFYARALHASSSVGDWKEVEKLVATLEMWNIKGMTSQLQGLKRQCERLKDGDCWSCGGVIGKDAVADVACARCKMRSKDWATKSTHLESVIKFIDESNKSADQKSGLFQRARVLFMTLSSVGRASVRAEFRKFQRGELDTLIVDEAGQALEPELLIALMGAKPQRLLMIGDPKQLPATVMSEKVKKLGFATSPMESLEPRLDAIWQWTSLHEQYRMSPDLRKWPSDTFYSGALRDAPVVQARTTPWGTHCSNPFAGCEDLERIFDKSASKCVAIVPVHDGQEKQEGTSMLNFKEAMKVATLAQKICRFASQSSVGVIAFYAAQRELLAREFKKRGLNDVSVNTVDGFQGGEKDVILVSFAKEKSATNFLEDPKRLNVCFTRARFALIIVGNLVANTSLPLFTSFRNAVLKEKKDVEESVVDETKEKSVTKIEVKQRDNINNRKKDVEESVDETKEKSAKKIEGKRDNSNNRNSRNRNRNNNNNNDNNNRSRNAVLATAVKGTVVNEKENKGNARPPTDSRADADETEAE